MLEIQVNEYYMSEIERLEEENKNYETKISDETPTMNKYFRDCIARNEITIAKYTEEGIQIIVTKEA